MERVAARGGDAGVGDRGEERVGEAQALAVALDDADRLGVRERRRGLVGAQRGLDVGRGRPRQRRRDVDRLARRGRQRVETAAHELLHARRQGQLRPHGRAGRGQGARDLEREERVPAAWSWRRASVRPSSARSSRSRSRASSSARPSAPTSIRSRGGAERASAAAPLGLEAPRHEHAHGRAQPAEAKASANSLGSSSHCASSTARAGPRRPRAARPAGPGPRRAAAAARPPALRAGARRPRRSAAGPAGRRAPRRAGRRAGRRAPRRPGPPRGASAGRPGRVRRARRRHRPRPSRASSCRSPARPPRAAPPGSGLRRLRKASIRWSSDARP